MSELKKLSAQYDASSVHADVSGRTYCLNGALPSSIRVEGEEILAAPICLRARFDGEEQPWDEAHISVIQEDAEQLLYTVQQAAGRERFTKGRVGNE